MKVEVFVENGQNQMIGGIEWVAELEDKIVLCNEPVVPVKGGIHFQKSKIIGWHEIIEESEEDEQS